MEFLLTVEQESLRDSVRDYLEGEYGPEILRRQDSEKRRDPAIWNGLVEMGLTSLLVPVAKGGLGLGLIDGVLIAVELGRANVSEPLADTALVAAPLLSENSEALKEIAEGRLVVALSHSINPWIADLDISGLALGDLPTNGPREQERLLSVDPLRRLFKRTGPGGGSQKMLDLAALMAAAQLLGGAEQMLRLASDYAKVREQFGQQIGAFQAIKHQLATIAVKTEFVRPVLLRAAYAAENGHANAYIHISHAKVAATDAAIAAAETAIQVHGAMGYTYEVDLHYWMKRAWALAGAWGDRAFHERRIADAVIGGHIGVGPHQIFESEHVHG